MQLTQIPSRKSPNSRDVNEEHISGVQRREAHFQPRVQGWLPKKWHANWVRNLGEMPSVHLPRCGQSLQYVDHMF